MTIIDLFGLVIGLGLASGFGIVMIGYGFYCGFKMFFRQAGYTEQEMEGESLKAILRVLDLEAEFSTPINQERSSPTSS
ncbi:MAG: hypothetical protein QHC90_13295 [Shinella sp.]|nr:hypothetical protein [Shinella sp.]